MLESTVPLNIGQPRTVHMSASKADCRMEPSTCAVYLQKNMCQCSASLLVARCGWQCIYASKLATSVLAATVLANSCCMQPTAT